MKTKSRNSYYLRKYGHTEAEVLQMLAEQGGVCKITGKPPGTRALHVDHDHAIPKIKLISKKIGPKNWAAYTTFQPKYPKLYFEAYGTTKSEAVRKVRKFLLRASVRGLLSWSANALLAKASDNHNVLQNAAEYLREYEAKFY